ncbi:MAG: hypothetical protein WC890_01650 [Candidatus Margulisiibacteriota bacterium]
MTAIYRVNSGLKANYFFDWQQCSIKHYLRPFLMACVREAHLLKPDVRPPQSYINLVHFLTTVNFYGFGFRHPEWRFNLNMLLIDLSSLDVEGIANWRSLIKYMAENDLPALNSLFFGLWQLTFPDIDSTIRPFFSEFLDDNLHSTIQQKLGSVPEHNCRVSAARLELITPKYLRVPGARDFDSVLSAALAKPIHKSAQDLDPRLWDTNPEIERHAADFRRMNRDELGEAFAYFVCKGLILDSSGEYKRAAERGFGLWSIIVRIDKTPWLLPEHLCSPHLEYAAFQDMRELRISMGLPVDDINRIIGDTERLLGFYIVLRELWR